MKQYGHFVPGIRPGKMTAQYLERLMTRITLAGAAFLAFIATMPQAVHHLTGVEYGTAYLFGGTGLLIVVGVALEIVQKIESQLMMRHYEGFMKKMSPKKGAGWQERFFTFADGKLTYYKGKDARAMFTDLDVDGSGALDEKEFAKLCRDLGRKLNKKAMAEAMAEMDRDGNGTVEWREFDIWWQANGGNALKKNQPAGEIILAECSDVSTTILTGGSMQINI